MYDDDESHLPLANDFFVDTIKELTGFSYHCLQYRDLRSFKNFASLL